MSPIDKFNYLGTLLEDEASRAIQGLPLTNAYNVAIEILKDRFGKPQTIVTAHMDDLLKLPSLGSNCRVKDLNAVLDQLTIHVLYEDSKPLVLVLSSTAAGLHPL